MVLESREAILALAPQLEALADRCHQPGAMHWLAYFLDPAVLRRRAPRLVLFWAPDQQQEGGTHRARDVRAAVLYFEYELAGLRTGVVATGDAVGFNSVIAPPGERASVAAAASRLMLERGAFTVLTTYESAHEMGGVEPSLPFQKTVRWATRERSVQRILHLGRTLEETLAGMGKATRFNLRYYRRRLEKTMECTFVPEAATLLHQQDLRALNASSLNPVAPTEFERRINSASSLPGSFLCGLQGPEGRWLSLIGGWRQGSTTVLHWQLNIAGLEKHSIGTVMRSHFLESEIGRGSRKLLIFGGTPHSMRHAFTDDAVADLVMQRAGLRAQILRRLNSLLWAAGLRARDNFVLETLRDGGLVWKDCSRTDQPARALAVKPVPTERAA